MASTNSTTANDGGQDGYLGVRPYTASEKAWLKKWWKNEFHFLMAYGLSIHSEEDREEGRAIARTFIKHDQEHGEPGSNK